MNEEHIKPVEEQTEAADGGEEHIEAADGSEEETEIADGSEEQTETADGGEEQTETADGGEEQTEAADGGEEPDTATETSDPSAVQVPADGESATNDKPVDSTLSAGGMPAVRILGRGDGVAIQLTEEDVPWSQILAMLAAHLSQAHGFFRGERVTVELGEHAVGARDLQQLLNVLTDQEIHLRMLRTAHSGVHQLAQDMGVAVTWQEVGTPEKQPGDSTIGGAANWEVLLSGRKQNPLQAVTDFEMPSTIVDAIADAVQGESRLAQPPVKEGATLDEIAPAVHSTVIEQADLVQRISAPPYLYRGTLRSGQIFRHAGSVIILGDVNPGAQVVSGSDVYIWGRLRGVVHAGAMGDENAVIGALDFEPIQVRIGGFIAMSPRGNANDPGRWFWNRQTTDRPEIARIVGGQVVVDQWDARMSRQVTL